jgi:Tol biopolymer transport system component
MIKKILLFVTIFFAINYIVNSNITISSLEISKLGVEVNQSTNQYPIYISEVNNALIFAVESNGHFESLYFSKYNSDTKKWSDRLDIKENYSSFSEINKGMKFGEIIFAMDGDLYSINFRMNKFKSIPLNINTKYIETSPSLSPDEQTLYFISNRPGGFGGKDIWSSERLSNGNWSEPVNLGKKINTDKDEESPFMMSDGVTLYFSSKGHNSFGGYDIFTSTCNDDGLFSDVTQLPKPINSEFDDLYFVTTTYGRYSYYSSDRDGSNKMNIYLVQ